jgi:hypothetical protein
MEDMPDLEAMAKVRYPPSLLHLSDTISSFPFRPMPSKHYVGFLLDQMKFCGPA